jgi:hypothetical protein
MNKSERNSLILAVGGIIALLIFTGWLIYTLQTLNDEVTCQQPLDKLNRADFQYCLSRELK